MTATTVEPTALVEDTLAERSLGVILAERARRKSQIYLGLVAIGMIAAAVSGGGQRARLAFGQSAATGSAYTAPVWITCGAVALIAIGCVVASAFCPPTPAGRRRVTGLVVLGTVAGAVGLLAWAARGNHASLAGVLAITVGSAVPMIFGSTSGVLSERSGTFSIAIEAQFLAGAFAGAFVGSVTHSAWIGTLAAFGAGLLVGAVMGAMTVRYKVSQAMTGWVLTSLVAGLTAYLAEQLLDPDAAALNSPPIFSSWSIPGLSHLPLVGAALFAQTPLFYLSVLLVLVLEVVFRFTRIGLRVRAAGENPQAALSSGVNARALRFWSTTVAGGIGGLGGAYFTLGSTGQFIANISSGLGFVALAAVILGAWRPAQAAAAALLFGFATSITTIFGLLKVDVPSSILLMTPYLVTVLVVAGVVSLGKAPAAAGRAID
jgi:simple sugar transport system permease protein